MPKHDFLTPKAIANRIKSKGLQKLRWYCQMCQKQCRDENGYKCHIMSESHQRQLLLVADNPGRFVGNFSAEFLKGFMDVLRRQFGTRRIKANTVYQEYIKDKDHYHMNATRWSTLSGFCAWLGKNGMVEAEPTPKGWYITYIDRSPEAMARIAAEEKKRKMDRDDEERTQRMVAEQIRRAQEAKKERGESSDEEPQYTELERKDQDEIISLKLFNSQQSSASTIDRTPSDYTSMNEHSTTEVTLPPVNKMLPPIGAINAFKMADKEAKAKAVKREERKRKHPASAVEEIFKMEDEKREKRNRKDYWLHEGIMVKVLHERLGDKYYKRKGVVEEVINNYTAVIRMVDTNDKLKIDQAHLETVIPAIGKSVLLVNGAFRGCKAILQSIDMTKYCVAVKVTQGPSHGRILENVPYEDISKLHVEQM